MVFSAKDGKNAFLREWDQGKEMPPWGPAGTSGAPRCKEGENSRLSTLLSLSPLK